MNNRDYKQFGPDTLYHIYNRGTAKGKIFLYSGIELGDTNTADSFLSLDKLGCVEVKTKTTMIYKNPDKEVSVKCPNPNCQTNFIKVVDMGYRKKSNCDVELTMDVLDYAAPGNELLIFTADGDFGALFEKAVRKGSKIKIVSHQKVYTDKAGFKRSRFSTKLRKLLASHHDKVSSIDIARWKDLIQKEVSTKS